jgi:hypothetical protein
VIPDKDRKDREERKDKRSFAALAPFTFSAGLALVFLALHLPYIPTSLEDLDSINFALGVRQFDVAHHQPHPPGYPVYIALGKLVHAAVPDEARALALLSIVAGALGAVAMAALFGRLTGVGRSTWVAVALGLTSPLYWFTAARPLSDMPGTGRGVGGSGADARRRYDARIVRSGVLRRACDGDSLASGMAYGASAGAESSRGSGLGASRQFSRCS